MLLLVASFYLASFFCIATGLFVARRAVLYFKGLDEYFQKEAS